MPGPSLREGRGLRKGGVSSAPQVVPIQSEIVAFAFLDIVLGCTQERYVIMRLFKKKISPEELGAALFVYVWSASKDERQDEEAHSDFLRRQPAPERTHFLNEILYLRMFVADYAAWLALKDKPGREKVREAYNEHLVKMTIHAPYGKEVLNEIQKRFDRYSQATNSQNNLAPPFTVGEAFAEFLGMPGDIFVVTKGSIEFTIMLESVAEMLKGVVLKGA